MVIPVYVVAVPLSPHANRDTIPTREEQSA